MEMCFLPANKSVHSEQVNAAKPGDLLGMNNESIVQCLFILSDPVPLKAERDSRRTPCPTRMGSVVLRCARSARLLRMNMAVMFVNKSVHPEQVTPAKPGERVEGTSICLNARSIRM